MHPYIKTTCSQQCERCSEQTIAAVYEPGRTGSVESRRRYHWPEPVRYTAVCLYTSRHRHGLVVVSWSRSRDSGEIGGNIRPQRQWVFVLTEISNFSYHRLMVEALNLQSESNSLVASPSTFRLILSIPTNQKTRECAQVWCILTGWRTPTCHVIRQYREGTDYMVQEFELNIWKDFSSHESLHKR